MLGAVAQEAAKSDADPEAALLKARVRFASSAISWLTPAQLAIVQQDLAEMEMSMGFDVAEWVLADRLGRARFANGRFS